MHLVLEDWSMRREADDRVHIDASDPAAGFGLALALLPEKPLVLHGERGYSRKGPEPGNASAYASWTRLAVEGTLALGDRELAVRGQAWFDHEFGSGQLSAGIEGWDWFSLQLDDGREVMLYALRGADGRPSEFSAGTLVGRDGSARHLARDDFTIEALASWTSRRSGARYPSGWRLRVPSHAIDVRALPVLEDCELDASRSSGVVYWEGPIRLEGTHAGAGFAELTGYAGTLAGRF
jgi:predicted secreted hydrolase